MVGKKVSRREASDFLLERYGIRARPATLAKYASIGGGPPFRRAGRFPIYDTADLDRWARMHVSPLVHSTSELTSSLDPHEVQGDCDKCSGDDDGPPCAAPQLHRGGAR